MDGEINSKIIIIIMDGETNSKTIIIMDGETIIAQDGVLIIMDGGIKIIIIIVEINNKIIKILTSLMFYLMLYKIMQITLLLLLKSQLILVHGRQVEVLDGVLIIMDGEINNIIKDGE